MCSMGTGRSKGGISRRNSSGSERGCCASCAQISLVCWSIFCTRRRPPPDRHRGRGPPCCLPGLEHRGTGLHDPIRVFRYQGGRAHLSVRPPQQHPHRAQTVVQARQFGRPRRSPANSFSACPMVRAGEVHCLRRQPTGLPLWPMISDPKGVALSEKNGYNPSRWNGTGWVRMIALGSTHSAPADRGRFYRGLPYGALKSIRPAES